MDFSEAIAVLADRVQKVRNNLNTEEATKTALVMPFIQTLGYDVFNPLEVVPEFIADIAGKKGEKVDYAIIQDDKPIMLIECKCCGVTLDDGKHMDATPFMEFSLDNIDPVLLPELRKLCKGKFDLKNTLDAVAELKFNRQVKLALAQNLENPDMDFIDYLLGRAGIKGLFKKTKEERYAPWVKRAFKEFIDEQIDSRLKTALAATSKKDDKPVEQKQEESISILGNLQGDGIITTDQEVKGYYTVRAIMSSVVDPERIFARDTKSYCGILLDNKNTKPVCRLHFNNPDNLQLETFDAQKNGTKHKLEKVSDIYSHADELRSTVDYYTKGKD
ncbi:MAG: restriction endonuclease [Desulfobulbus sp.]|nr:restriction endonuclease [Desulfobulbus sp.]